MKKILVIEDEQQMRRNICTILKMENFEVVSAENGREGVEAARSAQPDLILCDVMMPELDGEGVLAELAQDTATASIPFLFLTARGHTAFVRKQLPLVEEDCLPKPISAAELLSAIRERFLRPASPVRSDH